MAAPIVDDLAELFPDTVSVRKSEGGDDGFGNVTLGTAADYKCRISERVRQIRRASDGEETVSNVQITFAGSFGLGLEDEYTLPERFPDRTPTAIAVTTASDENGPHHQVVYF